MEKLNAGFHATVFKFKKGEKYYALKKQKISKSQALELKEIFKNKIELEDTTSDILRDIFFNKFILKKNKNHFAILYKYKITKCSDFKHELNESIKNNMPEAYTYHSELSKSKYCIEYVYDLKDGDLRSIFNTLNNNQII